jgi:D-sedoheptulose 7-phosphate isomerase
VTDFLYPFIERQEEDVDALLTDLATSARAKAGLSQQLRTTTLEILHGTLAATARDMADRFSVGGRLFTFGNGGSSTDASTLAALFARPPSGPPLPARCLTDDSAVLTALANDVGFPLVFSRQLNAHSRPGDIAVGFSTSGNSANLLEAFGTARRAGLLTVGFAGYQGGDMRSAGLDHLLVVGSESVHRIQETQAALGFALWERVRAVLQRRTAHG